MHIQTCLERTEVLNLPNLTAACVRIQRPPFSKRNLTLLEGCRNSIGGQVPTDPQQLLKDET
jgi:hypothetical protein